MLIVFEIPAKLPTECPFAGPFSRETLVHPTRVIQFLVGVRGKNETMAIGGPWSPSLDGAGTNCIKIGLPGKLILSKRKGLREVLFS